MSNGNQVGLIHGQEFWYIGNHRGMSNEACNKCERNPIKDFLGVEAIPDEVPAAIVERVHNL